MFGPWRKGARFSFTKETYGLSIFAPSKNIVMAYPPRPPHLFSIILHAPYIKSPYLPSRKGAFFLIRSLKGKAFDETNLPKRLG